MKLFLRLSLFLCFFVITGFSAKALTAGFTADVTAGCAPLVVNFTNTSTGATSYFWDFGTGTTSVLKDPSTSFLKPGTYIVKLTVYGPGGPITTTMTITVYPDPTVSFTCSDTTPCPNSPITFTSTTVGGVPGAITYLWSFGDGTTDPSPSPIHTYASPGYYMITLTATNAAGCTATLTLPRYIHVLPPPVADFYATTYYCKPPGVAAFTNISTGTPGLSYKWDFGDGGGSSLTSPTHSYGSVGAYTVKLTVTDGNGCVDSVIKPSYIYVSNITAAFTTPSVVCQNSAATFIDKSSPHISQDWYFGDGGHDVTVDGTHLYGSVGTYTVTLVIFDGTCYDTVKHPITVIAGPKITLTQSPAQPCPPPVGITFSASGPPGVSYAWSFGDGGTGIGTPVTHTYTWRGVRDIILSGTDPATGCVTTIKKTDTLYDMYLTLIDTPQDGCRPLTVKFSYYLYTWEPDTTVIIPPKYPYPVGSYTWDFGDGATLSGTGAPAIPYPHTYTAVGVYKTKLTITTVNGCTISDTGTIFVGDPPTVSAVVLPSHVCYGHPVTVAFKIITGPADYFWAKFSPIAGMSGPGDTIVWLPPLPGIYTATVYASYHGCIGPKSVIPIPIIVDSPMAKAGVSVQCSPKNRVNFTDLSYGDDSRTWVFGDGATSTVSNPTHDYPSPIVYNGYLATYNSGSGCRDTFRFSVDLTRPVVDFTASRLRLCRDEVDTFTAKITSGSIIGIWWHSIGISKDSAGVYTYIDTMHVPGLQSIRLITMDQNGCYDTLEKKNYVTVGHPDVSFTASPATGCWPLNVTFKDASTDAPGTTFIKYAWSFGDGGTATVFTNSVSHTFVKAGTFLTKLVVTDDIGCVDSNTLPLVTVYRPTANFHAYQYPCLGDSTQFIDASTSAASWDWDFGDGTKSALASPWHTYSATGSYTVRLIVTDSHGCKDTSTMAGYIIVTKVTASFYMVDSFSICPPLKTNFYNTSTGATSYIWDFGDGSGSSLMNPTDLYTLTGYYTVMLVSSNGYGCTDTAWGHANVYGYAGSFSYSPLSGCSPLTVKFKALITNVPTVTWDFSDGTTSKMSYTDSTDHVYVLPGSYVPKLILSDNTGCENSSMGVDTIKVDIVRAGFTTNPVCINQPITFTDTSFSYFSTITSLLWTMSDGSTTSVLSPTYVYNAVGTYPVSLLAVDGWGCRDSMTANLVVHALPDIVASTDTIVCLGDAATLSADGGVSYVWSPTTNVTCSNCNPTKASPTIVTTYTVVGTDEFQCTNSDTVLVGLKYKTVSHATGDTAICKNVVVQLHDSGGTNYQWIPATGLSSANAKDPYASPATTTNYMVIAKLGSCIPDTDYVKLIIYPLPTVDAGPDQRLIEGSAAQLEATGENVAVYSWGKDATLSCDSCAAPIATTSVTTTYEVNVTSIHGCKSNDTVTIHIFCDKSQIFMPNTFTPNGDGQNDIYYPRGIGVKSIAHFRIYNRWGQLLFERNNFEINDASAAWDGSFAGAPPRPDVYVYVLDAICETGEPINIKGDVTLIR